MKKIAGVIVGLIVAVLVISLIQLVSQATYPMPEGLKVSGKEAMAAWIKGLPLGAFIFVLCSHGMGALTGALTCRLIVGERWLRGTLFISGFLTLAGIMNLLSIPHPVWFSVVDILLYLPAALLGESLAGKIRSEQTSDDGPNN